MAWVFLIVVFYLIYILCTDPMELVYLFGAWLLLMGIFVIPYAFFEGGMIWGIVTSIPWVVAWLVLQYQVGNLRW